MEINNKFNIGDKVYLKSDIEQLPYIVAEIHLIPNNTIAYQIHQGTLITVHYELEIRATEDVVLKNKYNSGL